MAKGKAVQYYHRDAHLIVDDFAADGSPLVIFDHATAAEVDAFLAPYIGTPQIALTKIDGEGKESPVALEVASRETAGEGFHVALREVAVKTKKAA